LVVRQKNRRRQYIILFICNSLKGNTILIRGFFYSVGDASLVEKQVVILIFSWSNLTTLYLSYMLITKLYMLILISRPNVVSTSGFCTVSPAQASVALDRTVALEPLLLLYSTVSGHLNNKEFRILF